MGSFVTCSYSANGILAVGFAASWETDDGHWSGNSYQWNYDGVKGYLWLYDVSSWNMIYKQDFKMWLRSLYLTEDRTKLAASGSNDTFQGGEKCVILRIQ